MADNDRNPVIRGVAQPDHGNTARTGTGAHDTHRRDAERDTENPQSRGVAGRKQGSEREADIADALLEPDSDDPMTADQAEHLRILCEEAGEPFEPALNRSQAERRISELQRRTGFKP
jgi:hypothetical protein